MGGAVPFEEAREFLNHILPPTGFYVLAVTKGRGMKHVVFEDIDEMADKAVKLAKAGATVYHACASFAKNKPTGMRKQDNVLATKSVWVDLDCGEGKEYPNAKEAVIDLNRACKELGIPLPTIVLSGRGIHGYWVFDTPVIGAAKAKHIAQTAKQALQATGLKLDPSRTGDTASLLRPAGTLWFKENPPRRVTVKHYSKPVDRAEFMKKLEAVAPDVPQHTPSAEADEFSVPVDYPPADAKKVIKECAAMRHVAIKKGDVPEPLWYAAIGTVSYTKQGFKAGHYISDGYPGYSYAETQERMERWQSTCSGPATCSKFKSIDPSLCAGCTHKVTSPIQLGFDAVEVPEDDAPSYKQVQVPVEVKTSGGSNNDERMRQIDLDEALSKKLPEDLIYWDALKSKYRVAGNSVQVQVEKKDEDGNIVKQWMTILNEWLYPYRTRKNADGERVVEFYVRRIYGSSESARARWESIAIAGNAIADTNTLVKTLGTFGIYEANALVRQVKPMIKQYILDSIRAMEDTRGTVDEFDRMGWIPGEDGFVIGDRIISDGIDYPAVVASGSVPENVLNGMRTSGSLQNWVETINKVYNRPGAEAYQFVIAAAFAAPLVKLANIPDFHGIPVAITGAGANGKTTVAQAACSVFGDPLAFYAGGGDSQATTNALLAMVGKMRHLPYLFDEVTGRKSEDLQTILYAISNGRPKLRLQRDGSFQQSSKISWDTVTFVTSNDKITEVLQHGDVRVVDATQVRVFEIHMGSHVAPKLFHDVDPHELQRMLANDYGWAGFEYLKYVTKHKTTVRKIIETMRRKLMPDGMTGHDMKERFYRELAAVTLAGAYIANNLGLIRFDVKNLKEWAMNHIQCLRADRVEGIQTPEDVVAQFLVEHSHQVVHTHEWYPKRWPVDKIARVADIVRVPVARLATKPGKVFVDKSVFDEWLQRKRISRTWFFEEAERDNLLLLPHNGDRKRNYIRVSMYKGTDLVSANMNIRAYEFNPAKLIGAAPPLEVLDSENQEAVSNE